MEGRPLYRTVAAIGLAAHALSSLVHVVVVQGEDKVFFAVLLAVAAAAAAATARWSKGIWVSLVVGILLEVVTFWFVFPMVQGFAISALDAVPATVGFVGVWTAIIASILGVVRRRAEPRAFGESTRKKVLTGVAVVAVLAVASTALTFMNKETVPDAQATGATTVLMHDGDEFTPRALNAKAGEPLKLLVRNDDPFAHTFTVDDHDVNEFFGPGSEKIVEFTPTEAGDLEFVCEFHGDMKGTIAVS